MVVSASEQQWQVKFAPEAEGLDLAQLELAQLLVGLEKLQILLERLQVFWNDLALVMIHVLQSKDLFVAAAVGDATAELFVEVVVVLAVESFDVQDTHPIDGLDRHWHSRRSFVAIPTIA